MLDLRLFEELVLDLDNNPFQVRLRCDPYSLARRLVCDARWAHWFRANDNFLSRSSGDK